MINNISPQLYAANYDIGGEKGHGQGRETESWLNPAHFSIYEVNERKRHKLASEKHNRLVSEQGFGGDFHWNHLRIELGPFHLSAKLDPYKFRVKKPPEIVSQLVMPLESPNAAGRFPTRMFLQIGEVHCPPKDSQLKKWATNPQEPWLFLWKNPAKSRKSFLYQLF